jgi:hypothetical protein
LTFVSEEFTNKASSWNLFLKSTLHVTSAEEFMLYHAAAPNKELDGWGQDMGSMLQGPEYYETLVLRVYDTNISLKDFMRDHIGTFEPGIFVNLVQEWSALNSWLPTKDEILDWTYFTEAIGEETQVEMLLCNTLTVGSYLENCSREYDTFNEFVDTLTNRKDFSNSYKIRGGAPIGPKKAMILDEDIPETFENSFSEPELTSQILDH